jgi:DNA replication protein DnaC
MNNLTEPEQEQYEQELKQFRHDYQQRVANDQYERRRLAEKAVDRALSHGPMRIGQRDALDAVHHTAKKLYTTRANWDTVTQPTTEPCPTCHDAGWVRVERDEITPATVRECPTCGAERAKARKSARLVEVRADLMRRRPEADDLMELGALPFRTDYAGAIPSVAMSDLNRIQNRLAYALKATSRYTDRWPAGAWLSFDGPFGAGKTHLLAMIYRAARLADKTAIYTTSPDFEAAVTAFDVEHEDREELVSDLIAAEVLVWDEADRMTWKDGNGWTERAFFRVLDSRVRLSAAGVGTFHTVLAGNALRARLPGAILSRATAAGSLLVDLAGIPDARAIFAGDDAWKEGL